MALTDQRGLVTWAAKLDPLGQCAAGIQPAGHPPGDPAAGPAP
ncbi:hypothetical protein MI467_27220 [Delftia acidovorans]|nr:hypothetical protein [Delftia acidovorans]MCG8990548.1 hypothetical protein [Delftia acidovorans]